MTAAWYLPLAAFFVLALLEREVPDRLPQYAGADRWLNVAGLAIQGLAVPAAGYLLVTGVMTPAWPDHAGILRLGWWGAFVLNFVVIDALYYAEHRLFHHFDALWALHQCHHASPRLTIWATARNSLLINALFVYLLLNPLLGYLCDRPDGFYTAAALTAALDLWRHSRLPERWVQRWAGRILVTPLHHHFHHSPEGPAKNFGANLIVWDRIFGTAHEPSGYPSSYGSQGAPAPWRQFLFPW